MKQEPHHGAHNSLDEARHQFEEWRESRTLGTRIPETLWDLAVAAARRHGISKAAGELRLDYYKLKELMEPAAALAASSPPQPRVGVGFLELPPLATAASKCVFEIEDGEGKRLRAVLTDSAPAEQAMMARTFWSLTQ